MLSQQVMNGCKPYPEILVEGKVKVRGAVDEKATNMTDSAWGLALGNFKSLRLFSIAQIKSMFLKVSGRSPGEGNSNPLQNYCLENPMDRGGWQATVHGVTKSRTQLSD